MPTAAEPDESGQWGDSPAVRKTVTVLFADLGGSTRFGERTDPEVSRTVMARYYALLQSVIDANGGTVAKFMGDGMMATFGIPVVAENDAARAVQAGLDAQRRFTSFAADIVFRYGETLTLRVGVNTGEVVIGVGDADLIGDALNVAARLEKACRPGHVLVGEETWRLTRADIGYESLGEVTVAGRAEPVTIFEVAERAREAEGATPFVGRDREMRRLLNVFNTALADRETQMVTVLGSPGMGKTRLSRELCALVSATSSDAAAITFEVRCHRSGGSTFAPVAQLIREATGLGQGGDAQVARASVAAMFPESDHDRGRLADVLAGLLGAAPSRSVEETLWAIRRLVESIASTRPVVIVIDDIQWAEPLLLDLLEHLVEWLRGVAVVLVGLARPELRELRPALVETGRRLADVISLDGLDAAATAKLTAGLLGTARLPAGLIARLPSSTDGNPLFVRELVRMLVDDQVIRRTDDGDWELAIDADAVEVPPTIQSLLAARVERLPEEERSLLELASVIGVEFSLGALRDLAGRQPTGRGSIESRLERMRRKELVEPTGTYSGDEPVHRFHHVLIRDAAYRRLLKTTRADLHARVAAFTDRTAADLIGEHEVSIAYHYEQAFQYRRELGTVDSAAGDLGRRAAELLTVAARRSLDRDDLSAAGSMAERALRLTPTEDITGRSKLLQIGCECLLSSGDAAGGARLLEQFRAAAVGDARLAAWADCFDAQLIALTDPSRLPAADAMVTVAAATMEHLADGAGRAKAHQVRAGVLARLGRVGDCEIELDLALAAARAANDRRRVTAVLGAAPVAALWGPSSVARGGGRCLDVVRLLRITTASPSVEATSMRCQAVLEALRGRFDTARTMLASARATLEELGLRHDLLETELLAGVVELMAGDPAAAVAPLRAAHGGLGRMGVGADAGQAAALLSRALLALGQLDEADTMATASENLAGRNLKTAIVWRLARANVLAARGDVAFAVSLAEAAVEIANGTDYLLDQADAHLALANLQAAAGNPVASASAKAEAGRLYTLKGAIVPTVGSLINPTSGQTAKAMSARQPTSSSGGPDDLAGAHLELDDRYTSEDASAGENEHASVPVTVSRMAVENTASRTNKRTIAKANARDFDLSSTTAEDCEVIDRRRVIGMPTANDRTSYEDLARSGFTVFDKLSADTVALRGDRFALMNLVWATDSGFESSSLGLYECNDVGLMCRRVFLDSDSTEDFLAAFDELEDRYCASEGEVHAPIIRLVGDWQRAINRRDWAALEQLFAPDAIVESHRKISSDLRDGASVIEGLKLRVEQVPDIRALTRTVEIRNGLAFILQDWLGSSPYGGGVAWLHFTIYRAVGGQFVLIETFDAEDETAARARFEELAAADPRTPDVDNAVVRTARRGHWLASIGDIDGMARGLADDIIALDHRRVLSLPPIEGKEALLAAFRISLTFFASNTMEVVAVRGDRLALLRLTATSTDGFILVRYTLYEANACGLIHRSVEFDEDDLLGAVTEMDERYEVLCGDKIPPAERCALGFVAALSRRDFAAMEAVLAPEFAVTDRRTIGFPGASDRAEFIDGQVNSLLDICPDYISVVTKTYATDRVGLWHQVGLGTSPQGTPVEWLYLAVGEVSSDGRGLRAVTFADGQWPDALALFDEWVAQSRSNARTRDDD